MPQIQYVFDWSTRSPSADAVPESPANQPVEPPTDYELSQLRDPIPNAIEASAPSASKPDDGPPAARALSQAVAAGVFGMTSAGAVVPNDEDLAVITAEHANEMIVLLADIHAVVDATRTGHDPRTGRTPKTPEAQARLVEYLAKESQRLTHAYADAVAVYAEAFGDEAAAALDAWVNRVVADQGTRRESYEPSHPWHYFHAGDNAAPVPVDVIPLDADAGQLIESTLPKNRAKRTTALRELAEREQCQLDADKQRYADIVARGAEALSRYDREIAYSSDALARASALALKYRHISLGRGRLQWIHNELRRLGASVFFGVSDLDEGPGGSAS
jgi:hypothetical protein